MRAILMRVHIKKEGASKEPLLFWVLEVMTFNKVFGFL